MNVFDKISENTLKAYTQLGQPLYDEDFIKARQTFFSGMTNNNGFRQEKKEPRKDAQGLTRGDKKRKLREYSNSLVSEDRAPEFQNRNHNIMRGIHELRLQNA